MKRILTVLAIAMIIALACQSGRISAKEPEKAEEKTGTATATATATNTDTARDEEDEKSKSLKLKNMSVDFINQRIEIDAVIGVSDGLLELIACVPGAKTHETLLIMDINPSDLKAALLLIGLKDGFQLVTIRGKRSIDGERAIINVEWNDKEDKKQEYRVEDLIYNVYTKKAMRREGWVFIGSKYLVHPETGEKIFAARAQGNLVVTWHDFNAILDTPLPEGADDTTYKSFKGRVPASGTKVKVIITPHEEHNKKWRKKLEEEEKKKQENDKKKD